MIIVLILAVFFAVGLVVEFVLEMKAVKEQEESAKKHFAQPLVWCEMLQRWQ